MESISASTSNNTICMCDPLSPTTDCAEHLCDPFLGVFFTFQILLLIAMLSLIVVVELKGLHRYYLWRFILAFGTIAQAAKVVRTGLLLNDDYRHSMPLMFALLYNTHLCFASYSFLTLIFFGLRLYHDILGANMFDIVVIVLSAAFYYGQVIADEHAQNARVSMILKLSNGFLATIMSLIVIAYVILLRNILWNMRKRYALFFKTFVSAFITAVLVLLFCILLVLSHFRDFNSTRGYLVRHSIYESLFLLQFISLIGGFFIHFCQTYILHSRSSVENRATFITMVGNSTKCWCDPISETTDCFPDKCTTFFAVFFPLHSLVLIALIILMAVVEYRSSQKGLLWRIIFIFGVIAEFAKVLKMGLLLNEANRYRLEVFSFFLHNTHLCFASFAFITLLFFWARLQHDFVKNKQMFGKLFPIYVTVMTLTGIFYYLQVIFRGVFPENRKVSMVCVAGTGVISIVMSGAYVVYAVLIRGKIRRASERNRIFFLTYVSALVCSILTILVSLIVIGFTIVSSKKSTSAFLLRHSIYETLYISLFLSFPSGFFFHLLQGFVEKRRRTITDSSSVSVELRPQSAQSTSASID